MTQGSQAALLVLLAAAVPAAADTFAIVGATVHTMTTPPIEEATILVRDGRIAAVGKGVAVPAEARRVDARGRLVTPGWLNSATQLGLVEVSSVDATNDHALSSGALGAAFDIQFALNPQSMLIRQARADGLARAVSVPSASAGAPFAGFGALLHLGEQASLERPRLAMYAQVGGQSSGAVGGSRAAQWQLIRTALEEARAFRAGSKPAPRDSLLNRLDVAALKAVVDGTVPLVIETHRESDIRQAIALARDYPIRVILSGALEAWRAADELAAAGIPVILDPGINLPLYFDQVGVRADNAALLERAGVLMAFKVDFSIHATYNAGYALREVAGLAVANGLSHGAALAALTVNPAKIWGIEDRGGVITAGRDADLLIWDGDPFEPTSSLISAFVQGREVSRVTRQTELRDRYHPGKQPATLPPAYRRP